MVPPILAEVKTHPVPLVTSIEGNDNNKNGDADNRRSCFTMSSILVVVDAAKTCHVGQNKEGGVGNVLDSSGDGVFDIYDVGH